MTKAIALMSGGGGDLALPGEEQSAGKPVKGRPTMQKAALILYTAIAASAGGAKPGSRRGTVPFQFNPKEVTIAKTAKWERQTAKGAKTAGPPEFSGSEPCKLNVEMFFDATSSQDGSVVAAVEKLMSCMVPTELSAGQKKPTPPLVVLHWGAISSFPAFVTSVTAKYTLFSSDGTPIRASCAVQLEEMPNAPWPQNPTSGGHDVRRVHRTVAGDSLASVAYAEYGDPTRWRVLARYNGIDDPMRVPAGTTLLLPTPEELAATR
jgi:nucleoid-associated protein YgaU